MIFFFTYLKTTDMSRGSCIFPPIVVKLMLDYAFSFQKRTDYLFSVFSRSEYLFPKSGRPQNQMVVP